MKDYISELKSANYSGRINQLILSLFQFIFAVAASVVAAVSADQPAPYHPAPAYKPAPYKPAPYHPAPYKQPAYDEPAKYEYQYAVQDDYSKVDFDANEARDGYATNGGYRVALPDGRVQVVTYTVGDAYSGYVADVSYEGEAQYPEYKPTYKAAPYHPAPAYKPAPYHA